METLTQLSAGTPLIDSLYVMTLGDFMQIFAQMCASLIAVILGAFMLGMFAWSFMCGIKETIAYLFDRHRIKKGVPIRFVYHHVQDGEDSSVTAYIQPAGDSYPSGGSHE